MTNIDLGPLQKMVGRWRGDTGMDIAPEPDGPDENPYYEEIIFSPVEDDIENAESQELVAVHYRQIVRKKKNDKVFHDQTGYWVWEPNTESITHSFTIPRVVSVHATGKASINQQSELSIQVSANNADQPATILQSSFMRDNAVTESFAQSLTVSGNTLRYKQTTVVTIYEHKQFAHSDENTLVRVK